MRIKNRSYSPIFYLLFSFFYKNSLHLKQFTSVVYSVNTNEFVMTKKMLAQARVAEAYNDEKPRFMARLIAAGRTLEEAEDLIQEVYAETLENLQLIENIINLPAWINTLFTRRLIDAWRHEQARDRAGETDVAEETLQEIIADVGLDPQDAFIRDSLTDALNDAIKLLPAEQRQIIEAQVFGEKTFREIAELSGESIDTLTARKRYAVRNLSRTLRHWIEDTP